MSNQKPHATIAFFVFSLLAATGGRAQSPSSLRLTVPRRMVNDKTITLRAEILDPAGAIDWRMWSASGTLSVRRLDDGSVVHTSITFFDDHAGIPAADSIRFYNGVGSVSFTLDPGPCEPEGDLELTVSVAGLATTTVIHVLDQPPMRTLSGTLSGSNLSWGPQDGVIHLTGDVSWNGDLNIAPGTLVMLDPGVDLNLSSGRRLLSLGTQDDPIYFFATAGPPAMLLPNICVDCDLGTRSNSFAWGQIRHSGSAFSAFHHTIITGGGNGSSEGHTRPPMLRFADSSSFELRDSVLADIPGKAIYCVGSGTYNIVRSLITRCGHGTEFTSSGYTLNILNSWYTSIGRGPGTISCGGTTYDCGFDGDLINPRAPGNILIKGCVLTDGGDEAIDNSVASLTVEDTIIYNVRDRAYTDDGGGAHVNINNCLIFGNGGAFGNAGSVTIVNSTVYGGGGIGGSGNVVTKSILWPQTLNGCPGTFQHNLLGSGSTVSCGPGNFTADPSFVRTSGPNYDFDLQSSSPAITAGPAGERIGWLGFPVAEPCADASDCDDADSCTADTCVSGACRHTNSAGCVSCTGDDDCGPSGGCAGNCVGGICSFVTDCDDELTCTEDDTCLAGYCRGTDICTGGQECSPVVNACVRVPVTLTFQQGVSGYTGTQDTQLFQEFPDTSYGDLEQVEWDAQESTSPPGLGMIFALVRFDGIFGSGPGQISPDAADEITSATFNYNTYDTGDDGEMHEALVDWNEQATWNGFGAVPGPQDTDYGPPVAYPSGSQGGSSSFSVDVTGSIRAWAQNPAANKGWVILPTGTNGAEFRSSEYTADITARPKLTVVIGTVASFPKVLRQPYLQTATPTSMTIVWLTDTSTDSQVRFGTSPGTFDRVATGPAGRNHIVNLTGLTPDTTYYYEVGSLTQVHAGGCDSHYFRTPPLVGTPARFRVWAFGDSGKYTEMQFRVKEAMRSVAGSELPQLALHVGDIVYETPSEDLFTKYHFDVYEELFSCSVFWPSTGNHDVSGSTGGPYFDAFVLPTSGESGGVPSGTERYYSFDYANAHFVALDTEQSSLSPGSPMLNWLGADLAATDQQWLIVFFHHAPYTKGSHDSDNAADSGGRAVSARENIVPILETHGVDLVITGHTHLYERSYLINGAYGYGAPPNYATPAFSVLQANGNVVNAGNGRPGSGGPYVKSPWLNPEEGAVYAVIGHGGRSLDTPLGQHPVMQFMERAYGSALIDIDGSTLTYRNVRMDGAITDSFTIVKACVTAADCEDGRYCNGAATCIAGNCEPGPARCPGQLCDEAADACVWCLVDADCGDGLFCNGAESCAIGGSCLPGVPPCPVGVGCDEQSDQCAGATCTLPEHCNDANPCTDDACVAGSCTHAPNASPCSDGSACTTADTCAAGVCVGGTPPNCDDGNVCTVDSCSTATGCVHANNSAPCNDGSACTTVDTCAAGVCVGGTAPNCDDGNVCTDDSCSPAIGCVYVASGACIVSGTVRYYRSSAVSGSEPSTKPVPNVEVDVIEDGEPKDATDSAGFYAFPGQSGTRTVLALGKLGAARASDHNGAIGSFDASRIAQASVNPLPLFSANQFIAGDVTGNGALSALDAALVAQFAAELIDHFPVAIAAGSDWAFRRCDVYIDATNHNCGAPSYSHSPLTQAVTDDFYAILYGDVTGNWQPVIPLGPRGAEPEEGVVDGAARASTLAAIDPVRHRAMLAKRLAGPSKMAVLTVDGTQGSLRRGDRRQVELKLSDADGVLGLDLRIAYDPARFRIVGVEPAGIGSEMQFFQHDASGTLRVGLFGPVPLSGSGGLLVLTVEALRSSWRGLPIEVTGLANEGAIRMQVAAGRRGVLRRK